MKIAFIVPSLINKGPIIVVDTLVRNLINQVEKVDLFYFDEKYGIDFCCQTYRIDFDTPISFDNYDIIHSHGFRPDKYVAKWKNNISNAKVVTTIHSDIACDLCYNYNFFVSFIFTKIWLHYIKKFDAVVVISDQLKKIYECKLKSISRVYNGIDITYRPVKNDPSIIAQINKFRDLNYKIIGSYAYLTRIKGLEQLIKVLEKRKDLAVVIIGEGEAKNELIELSRTLNVIDRTLFLDYLPTPYNYLSLFDVYAMCSRSEGFGLAAVEATLMQTPVVCSNISIFKEIFDDTKVSFFELDNISSLLESINIAISTIGKLKAKVALNYSLNNFSGYKMASNYLDIYSNLLNGKI